MITSFIYRLDIQNVFGIGVIQLRLLKVESVSDELSQHKRCSLTVRNICKVSGGKKKKHLLHTHLKSIQLEEVQDLHSDCVSGRKTSWDVYY